MRRGAGAGCSAIKYQSPWCGGIAVHGRRGGGANLDEVELVLFALPRPRLFRLHLDRCDVRAAPLSTPPAHSRGEAARTTRSPRKALRGGISKSFFRDLVNFWRYMPTK